MRTSPGPSISITNPSTLNVVDLISTQTDLFPVLNKQGNKLSNCINIICIEYGLLRDEEIMILR